MSRLMMVMLRDFKWAVDFFIFLPASRPSVYTSTCVAERTGPGVATEKIRKKRMGAPNPARI